MKEHWKIVPEGEKGTAKIVHFEISKTASMMTAFHGGLAYCEPGKFCKLVINGNTVMSDTRMERISNSEVVSRANGDVLIAGLGMGMILVDICPKENVWSVLVVEKNQDVIDLVLPHVRHGKLTVVCADIFDWRPEKGRKFDTIYFDIWSDMNTDFLEEMAKLGHRFKGCLNRGNPNRYMDSWSRDILRAEKKKEQRRGGLW